jgi:hypothetical protein
MLKIDGNTPVFGMNIIPNVYCFSLERVYVACAWWMMHDRCLFALFVLFFRPSSFNVGWWLLCSIATQFKGNVSGT